MFTNFKELEAYVLSHKNKKRIVLANAHDEPALSAVVNAHRRGVVDGTLLGKKDEILALLREMNEDPAEYEIVDFDGAIEAFEDNPPVADAGVSDQTRIADALEDMVALSLPDDTTSTTEE